MLNLQFRPAINYRLASAINPPASPSTNLRLGWCFDLRLCLGSFSNFRRRLPSAVPAINSQLLRRLHPSVFPSDQRPTRAGCCSSSLPSGPTSNPSSAVRSSSLPSDQLPARARYCIVQICLRIQPPAFAGCRMLQLSFRTNLRLAPDTESSSSAFQPTSESSSDITPLTSPPDQLPTFVSALSFGSAFRPTSRLAPALCPQAFPLNQPPTCVGCCALQFCQRSIFDFLRSLNSPAVPSTNCQLALAINLSAVPANQLSDLHLRFDPPDAVRLSSGLRHSSVFQRFR